MATEVMLDGDGAVRRLHAVQAWKVGLVHARNIGTLHPPLNAARAPSAAPTSHLTR